MADALTPEQMKLAREEIDKLESSYDKLNEAEKVRLIALKNQLKLGESSLEYLERQQKANKELLRSLEELQEKEENLIATQIRANRIQEVAAEASRNEIKLIEKQIEANDNLDKKVFDRYEALKEAIKVDEIKAKALKNVEDRAEKAAKTFGGSFADSINMARAEMEKGGVATYVLDKSLIGLQSGFMRLVDVAKDLVFQFDSVTKGFEKQFQVGDRYKRMIEETYRANNIYGLGLDETAESLGSLITVTTDFTMMTGNQQKMLLNTGTILSELGVSNDDFARGVQNSMKLYGQSVSQAENTSLELMETARALGVAPGEMAAQYAKMGSSLAKFGQEGTATFKELARIQKITGLEMEKVLGITNKFDTFEGAATQAGQLNAALGGNFVNAMDLMMATDPVERFEMIRGSLENAGLAFDEMSYYQKQFYAESLGLSDVSDLALLMSGNTDLMAGATQKSAKQIEEEAKRAQEQLEIKEKLTAVMYNLAEAFLPVAEVLDKVAQFMIDNADAIKKVVEIALVFAGILTVQRLGGGLISFAEHLNKAGGGLKSLGAAFVDANGKMTGFGKTMSIYVLAKLFNLLPAKAKPIVAGIGLITAAIYLLNKALNKTGSAATRAIGSITDMSTGDLPAKIGKKTGGNLMSKAGGFLKKIPGAGLLGRGAKKFGLKGIGKLGARLLPGVGTAMLAYDAIGGISKLMGGPSLPGSMFAQGGGVMGPTLGLVGERGPEAMVPGDRTLGSKILEAPIQKALMSGLGTMAMMNPITGPFALAAKFLNRSKKSNKQEEIKIKLEFDNDMFQDKVVTIARNEQGEYSQKALIEQA